MSRHWTDEDFLNALYDVGPRDGHLESCPACRDAFSQWMERRRLVLAPPAIPAEILQQQRQAIYARIDTDSATGWFALRWAPALAVVVLALTLVFQQMWWVNPPESVAGGGAASKQATTLASLENDRLMTDIYSTVYASEPDVVTPLRGLFEEQ